MTRQDFIKIYGDCPLMMARRGVIFSDIVILKIVFDNPRTVPIHYQHDDGAKCVMIMEQWTIAHEIAHVYGYITIEDQTIKRLRAKGWYCANKHIFTVEDIANNTAVRFQHIN